jgi:predicted transcriptional regulator
MKDLTVMVLDEADHEFIQMLRNLGAPKTLAFVIVYYAAKIPLADLRPTRIWDY